MSLSLSSLLHYWATHRGLQPLRAIEHKVEHLDSTRLHDRFATETLPCELKLVAAKLNDLLDRLDASFKRERSFSSNAAHELRTPLAELKAILQVGMGSEADPEFRRYFTDANSVTDRMQSLLNALLTLADGSRAVSSKRVAIDLGALLRTKVHVASHMHPASNILLDAPDTVTVLADEPLLHGIIDNLLANALEYADSCQPIRCRVFRQNEQIALQFSNRCDSLDDSDLALMGDTFWRKESARIRASWAWPDPGANLRTLSQLKLTIARLRNREVAFTLSGLEAPSTASRPSTTPLQ